MTQTLKLKKIYTDVIEPKYATAGSNCFDIHAYVKAPVIIQPGQSVMIESGLAMGIPPNFVVLIFSRSGHGHKHRIRLSNTTGVIDSDYVNQVYIPVCNDSAVTAYTISPGDRIAQALLIYAPQASFEWVEQLEVTTRAGGFGSTGK